MSEKQEVKVEYHKNGKKKSETPYKDGKKNGVEKNWFEVGNPYYSGYAENEITYKDGKKNGVERGCLEDEVGMVVWNDGVKELEQVWYYYNDGVVGLAVSYRNGEKELEKEWCVEERTHSYTFYKNGKKQMKTYFYEEEEMSDEIKSKLIHFQELEEKYKKIGYELKDQYWI